MDEEHVLVDDVAARDRLNQVSAAQDRDSWCCQRPGVKILNRTRKMSTLLTTIRL